MDRNVPYFTFFRTSTPVLALSAALVASPALAQEDMSKPEIKVEKKKDANGREQLYMYIDGVKVHETDTTKQPLPSVVKPGDRVGAPPSDAILLFDGTAESFAANWTDTKGGPSKWKVVDGAMESVRRAGYIQSKQEFGSCQLHIEFATPSEGRKPAGPWKQRGLSDGHLRSGCSIVSKTRPTPMARRERSMAVPSHL